MRWTDVFIVVFLLSFTLNTPIAAQDIREQSREQQIAERLALTADVDEIINLEASGGGFIGLYKSTRANKHNETHGVVILVHGMGAHPDWPDVISPLRRQLTEFGWSTLSIQLPILSPQAPVSKYGKTLKIANSRIQTAVEYLHTWEIGPIILLGYGFGAAQSANYLVTNKSDKVMAFVSVSMLAQKFIRPELKIFEFIGEITIPILDIYGEKDLVEVREGIDDRRLAASKNGNTGFQQIELQKSDHHYLGQEDVLVEQIQNWLKTVVLAKSETTEISDDLPEILSEIQYNNRSAQ